MLNFIYFFLSGRIFPSDRQESWQHKKAKRISLNKSAVFLKGNVDKCVSIIESLDQGHLHPKLEVPGLTGPVRALNLGLLFVGGEHSRKEPFRQLVNGYSKLLHMSPRQ